MSLQVAQIGNGLLYRLKQQLSWFPQMLPNMHEMHIRSPPWRQWCPEASQILADASRIMTHVNEELPPRNGPSGGAEYDWGPS